MLGNGETLDVEDLRAAFRTRYVERLERGCHCNTRTFDGAVGKVSQVGAAQSQRTKLGIIELPQLGRRELAGDATVIHVHVTIGNIHEVMQAMLRNDDGLALRFHAHESIVQAQHRAAVEVRRGLVHHVHNRVGGVHRTACDLLLLSS